MAANRTIESGSAATTPGREPRAAAAAASVPGATSTTYSPSPRGSPGRRPVAAFTVAVRAADDSDGARATITRPAAGATASSAPDAAAARPTDTNTTTTAVTTTAGARLTGAPP